MDAGAEAGSCEVPASERVCERGERQCWGNRVMRCVDCGQDFVYEACGESELCKAGECQPVANGCNTALPFRLSASQLSFESTGQLRASSRSLTLENCAGRELVVDRAAIRRRAEAPFPPEHEVFEFGGRTTVDRVRLPAGEQMRLDLRYAPVEGFFVDEPVDLLLDVRAEQTYVTEVPLDRRIHCVSADADVELGVWELGEGTEIEVPVVNCGNAPIEVRPEDLAGVGGAGVTLEPADGEASRRLDPGGVTRYGFEIAVEQPGRVDLAIPFEGRRTETTSSRPETTTARLRGRAEPGACASPASVPGLQSRRAGDEQWESKARREIAPGEAIELRGAPELELAVGRQVWLAAKPERSGAHLEATEGPKGGASRYLRFAPDVPGSYTFAYRGAGEGGRPSCESEKFRLEVAPESPLYVELTWETAGDPIDGDGGYGRGADLNLHVNPQRDGESGGWADPIRDCYQTGGRAGRECRRAEGRVRAVSVGGGGPEAIAFGALSEHAFAVAVRMWNAYRFAGAQAVVRVYRNGELLEGFPRAARLGRTNGTVWHVGVYHPDAGQFVEVDRIRKDFER